MLRSTGIKFDLRLHTVYTYAYYRYISFNSFISLNGDCYDRFILRMNEMLESLFIINQLIWKLLNNTANTILKNLNLKKITNKKKVSQKFIWKI